MQLHRFWAWLPLLLCLCPVTWATEQLVVYSGRSDKFLKPVMEAFTRETGINIIIHSATSTALINKLRLEKNRTRADLFISNDAGNLQIGSDLGLFQTLPEHITASIPANFRSPDDTWIGLSARARVLVLNTRRKDLAFITSVFDLANPSLQGRLAITNSTNESYIAGVTVYMQAVGPKKTKAWLQGMKSNVDSSVFNKHSRIVKAIATGKRDVGLINHYYFYRHLDRYPDAHIRIVLPDQGPDGIGVAWNVTGVAITKYTGKRESANKLVAFLVSPRGQSMFAQINREYPTRKGVPAAAGVPQRKDFKVADVPLYQLGKQRSATLDLIEEVGMP